VRIAVTGGSGFLGRAVVSALLADGHAVSVLKRGNPEVSGGARVVLGELKDPCARGTLLKGADVLVHLAALGVQSRDRRWGGMLETNVVWPVALLEDAARSGIRRAIAAGTCLEYQGHGSLPDALAPPDASLLGEDASTEPGDGYGATKAAGGTVLRARARELGVPFWYLRFASLYGPEDDPQKLLPSAVAAALAGRSFEMSPGEQVREWLHLDDAVRAVLAAVSRDPEGPGLVNVGTGEGRTLRDVVSAAYRVAGADPALVRAGARPYRAGEVHRLVMDVRRAQAYLGWNADLALDRGLVHLVDWARRSTRE
jgi:nucleoside-diphosphate-sugar epimerase